MQLPIAPRELGFAQIELQLIATARNGRGGTGRDEIGVGGAAAAQREQGIRADRLDQKNPVGDLIRLTAQYLLGRGTAARVRATEAR